VGTRIEIRTGHLIRVDDWLPADDSLRGLWKDLTSVLCIESTRSFTHRGEKKQTHHTRYYISSSTASVAKLMAFARSHWGIENSLHWVMDVTFGEDASRIRTMNGAQNFATIRRVAASLLKQSSEGAFAKSIRGRKKQCGWSTAYLLSTLKI